MAKGMQKIADEIPHETRHKILMDWLPDATPSFSDTKFKLLWEAYFIYVDPSQLQKTDCSQCRNNVLKNWKLMIPAMVKAEKKYNEIENLY